MLLLQKILCEVCDYYCIFQWPYFLSVGLKIMEQAGNENFLFMFASNCILNINC